MKIIAVVRKGFEGEWSIHKGESTINNQNKQKLWKALHILRNSGFMDSFTIGSAGVRCSAI